MLQYTNLWINFAPYCTVDPRYQYVSFIIVEIGRRDSDGRESKRQREGDAGYWRRNDIPRSQQKWEVCDDALLQMQRFDVSNDEPKRRADDLKNQFPVGWDLRDYVSVQSCV